jgi:hypothetical protein
MALSLVSAEVALSVRPALPANLPVQFQFMFLFSVFSFFQINAKINQIQSIVASSNGN